MMAASPAKGSPGSTRSASSPGVPSRRAVRPAAGVRLAGAVVVFAGRRRRRANKRRREESCSRRRRKRRARGRRRRGDFEGGGRVDPGRRECRSGDGRERRTRDGRDDIRRRARPGGETRRREACRWNSAPRKARRSRRNRSTQTRARFRKARWTPRVRRASSGASSASSLACPHRPPSRRLRRFSPTRPPSLRLTPPRRRVPRRRVSIRRGRLAADEATILATDEATIARRSTLSSNPDLVAALPDPPLPNPRGFVSDVSDSEFDKTDASDWETEEQFSRADARLEAAHDTDAGGYGTARETFANDDPRAFHTRRFSGRCRAGETVWRRRSGNARRWRRVSPRRNPH